MDEKNQIKTFLINFNMLLIIVTFTIINFFMILIENIYWRIIMFLVLFGLFSLVAIKINKELGGVIYDQ